MDVAHRVAGTHHGGGVCGPGVDVGSGRSVAQFGALGQGVEPGKEFSAQGPGFAGVRGDQDFLRPRPQQLSDRGRFGRVCRALGGPVDFQEDKSGFRCGPPPPLLEARRQRLRVISGDHSGVQGHRRKSQGGVDAGHPGDVQSGGFGDAALGQASAGSNPKQGTDGLHGPPLFLFIFAFYVCFGFCAKRLDGALRHWDSRLRCPLEMPLRDAPSRCGFEREHRNGRSPGAVGPLSRVCLPGSARPVPGGARA